MLVTIILFIAILGILVFVHELGHFIMARKMGMAVEEFGFGFPPRLFGIKRGKTMYSINLIPVGGFVKIKGEQGDQRDADDSFAHKKIWQRAVVLSAGVAMNVLLAYVLISFGLAVGLPSVSTGSAPAHSTVTNQALQIIQVSNDSPAAAAGLSSGDIIKSIDQTSVQTVTAFQEYTKVRADTPITVTVQRGKAVRTIQVTPKNNAGENSAIIGVYLAETATVRYVWYAALWQGARTTIDIGWQIIVTFFTIIKNLIIGHGVGLDVAGPVGIAAMTGQVAKLGAIYILQFTALLSINLAIINFVPFPALDGGRVLFLIIEKIRRKAVNQRVEAIIHNVGFFLLLSLVALVTFRDVTRLGFSIKQFFQ